MVQEQEWRLLLTAEDERFDLALYNAAVQQLHHSSLALLSALPGNGEDESYLWSEGERWSEKEANSSR